MEEKNQEERIIKFSKITANIEYSIAISQSGELYSWGFNAHGRLGLPNVKYQYRPKKIPYFESIEVVEVKAGYNHVLALTVNNDLYSWGNNELGELGLGNDKKGCSYYEPQEITYFKENNLKIKKICAGYYVSYAITSDGRLYGWGSNLFYKLGLNEKKYKSYYNTPQEITYFKENNLKVIDVKAQFDGVIVKTECDQLYAWGYNQNGELGIGNIVPIIQAPTKIHFPNNTKIKEYQVGDYHGMALLESNKLYVWGYNAEGQLGIKNKENIIYPIVNERVTSLNIKNIFLGPLSSSGIITKDNKIYTWGYNSYGKLGIEVSSKINYEPIELKDLFSLNEFEDIVFGYNHSFIKDKTGIVYAMGLNTSGSLGLKERKKIYKPTILKIY